MPIPALLMGIISSVVASGAGAAASYGAGQGMRAWQKRNQERPYQSWTDRYPGQARQRRSYARRGYYRRYDI